MTTVAAHVDEAAAEALRISEARLKEAQRLAHMGSWVWEVGHDEVSWSPELYRIYGLDPDAGPATFGDYLGRVHPEDRERVATTVQRTLATLEPYEHEYRIVLDGRRVRWVHARGEVAEERDGVPVRLTGYCQDVTERRRAEDRRRRAQAELAAQQRILERIARGEPVEATLTTLCRRIEAKYPGARCSVLLVDSAANVLRHAAGPSLPPEYTAAIDGLPVEVGMGACGTAGATRELVVVSDTLADPLTAGCREMAASHDLRSVWSHPLTKADGDLLGTFAVYRSTPHHPRTSEIQAVAAVASLAALAIERDLAEKALAAAANVDSLTGLPNRARFLQLVEDQLAAPDAHIALMFVDLDRFNLINDSLGHPAGDRILGEVAARLEHAVEGRAVVARFGGDEFTLMVPAATAARVDWLADRVGAALTEPFILDGGEFFLSASIGIAMNDHPADASKLVRDADAAMYAAKAGGPGRYAMFDARLRERLLSRVTLETDLRRAIERDEFVMHYQPIVDLASHEWTGVEALVRWEHPEHGLIAPDRFIGLAEETGLIVPLGLRILELVADYAARSAASGRTVRVGANVSVVQLTDPMFAAEFQEILDRHGLAPEQLVLEVTESAVMEHLESARAALERVRALGTAVVIDDFGTGYSSIARLGELPISAIKIDRRFTAELGSDPQATKVLAAITDLGHALDLRVVAEGIETAQALATVCELGCGFAQGYYLSRPVPEDALAGVLGRSPAGC